MCAKCLKDLIHRYDGTNVAHIAKISRVVDVIYQWTGVHLTKGLISQKSILYCKLFKNLDMA